MLKSFQPTKKPHIVLTIQYKSNIDREQKRGKLRSKGLMVDLLDTPTEVLCMGYLNTDDIVELSSDSDIEEITGKASPVIRA